METCESIIAELMDHLQTVGGVGVVVRGEHMIPDIVQFPAIAILEGEDNTTEASKRGNKQQWDLYFVLLVQGTDSDDELPALATFRESFRLSMVEFRSLPKPLNGVMYQIGRGMPGDAGLGNYVVAQTLAYRCVYAEPSLG